MENLVTISSNVSSRTQPGPAKCGTKQCNGAKGTAAGAWSTVAGDEIGGRDFEDACAGGANFGGAGDFA